MLWLLLLVPVAVAVEVEVKVASCDGSRAARVRLSYTRGYSLASVRLSDLAMTKMVLSRWACAEATSSLLRTSCFLRSFIVYSKWVRWQRSVNALIDSGPTPWLTPHDVSTVYLPSSSHAFISPSTKNSA